MINLIVQIYFSIYLMISHVIEHFVSIYFKLIFFFRKKSMKSETDLNYFEKIL